MCYVGKATKIFIFIVTALAVVGLVFGFGFLHHHHTHHDEAHQCVGAACSPPVLSDPLPASTTSTAGPPYSPPSPVAVSQGPSLSMKFRF